MTVKEYSDNTVTSLYGFKQDVKEENNDMWIYFFLHSVSQVCLWYVVRLNFIKCQMYQYIKYNCVFHIWLHTCTTGWDHNVICTV